MARKSHSQATFPWGNLRWPTSPQICSPHSIKESKPTVESGRKQVNRSFPGAVPLFPSLQAAFRIFLGLKRNRSGVRRGCGVKVNSLGFQMPQRPGRRPFIQGPERNTLITGWTILDTILGIAKKHVYKGLWLSQFWQTASCLQSTA